ncbi:MAG: DUF1801 domain-containing protein [Acidobacteria bacterium]|nr:DUF1801 domain-containing protein [Acidobacteriota bacterium]
MAEPKTKKTDASVEDFIDNVADETRRDDCRKVIQLMQKATGEKPKMWGASIIGFGTYTYHYASGRSGDWPLVGLSPRKANLTLYLMDGFAHYDELMAKLGKHKTGKSCLYLNKLTDVDLTVLRELIEQSVAHVRKIHQK